MVAHNVEGTKLDISCFRGDTIKMSFEVKLNGEAAFEDGDQIDIAIRKSDGNLVKEMTSGGDTPEITLDIPNTKYSIKAEGLTEAGTFKYDVQLTKVTSGDILTIQSGTWQCNNDQKREA